jgi:hypothetical protein
MLTDHLSIIIGTNDQPKIIHILLVAIWIFFFFFKRKKRRVEGMGGMVGVGEGVAHPPNFLFFQTDLTYALT